MHKMQSAMQVMELWDNAMTVKCDGGCITKPYSEFEKVEDITKFNRVYDSKYFEDNRNLGFDIEPII